MRGASLELDKWRVSERRCDHLPLGPMQTRTQGGWQDALVVAPRSLAQATCLPLAHLNFPPFG